MSGFSYHGALAPLSSAVGQLSGDVRSVSYLLHSGFIRQPMLRKIVVLLQHVRFAVHVFCSPASASFFVREFSNIPLKLVFPLIRSRRGGMSFLVNHNLQWTVGNRMERAAFSKLGAWGCRFVFFEHVPSVAKTVNACALPHPVPESQCKKRGEGESLDTIGVIGQYRPEKGIDELLEQLKPLCPGYRILLALPNLDEFKKKSMFGDAGWLVCRDTSDFGDYFKTIAECSVVVLNHPGAGYEYRASGLIADAAAVHVPVIVRDLPLLASQVNEPVCIGETFTNLAELPDCIERVRQRLASKGYDFDAYKDARSGARLAERLEEVMGQ